MKMKLIIIDDEPDFCQILQLVFSKKGFEVFLFHSLIAGLEAIETIKPDIVILDNNLPKGLGWKQCRDLATLYPLTQFHLISAFEDKDASEPTIGNSKIHLWQKPMRLEDLSRCF